MLSEQWLNLFKTAQQQLQQGFADLPTAQTISVSKDAEAVMQKVAERLTDNYPYHHPLYAGQMLKPPHPIAAVAYMLAMNLNPNNHALDGGRASSAMEKEAVAEISKMFGWSEHLGHLTSGGTMANLEALWIAGQIHPKKTIVASDQAHYTHSRITNVLQLDFDSIGSDSSGRMDCGALEERLLKGDVGTVVVTLGTTGTGSVDPLWDILQLRKKYSFRIHVDTAYGGYFTLANNLTSQTTKHFDSLNEVDSIVIDPHKHGLQPYGCGCVLFKNPKVGKYYSHDSPYTYFSSKDLHLGEISLECSRAGAAAVALWATQKLLPMEKGGEFAISLQKSRNAAVELYNRLQQQNAFLTVLEPELDIVIWAPKGKLASQISKTSQQQFTLAAEKQLHLALIKIPSKLLKNYWPEVEFDCEQVSCLRSCLMKPEHLEWLDQIWKTIQSI